MIHDKIKTREALAALCETWRSQGKTIGFTSGAFDLIHAGHVRYLEQAKQMCDVLIVGVNTDTSVRAYKGPDRPIVAESFRVQVVAALESVSFVFPFEERRNQKNIHMLKPDFYIKAGDYTKEALTSGGIVENNGGEVRLIPVENDISTTDIVQKIAEQQGLPEEIFLEHEKTVHIQRKPAKRGPAVFFDRDGTINKEIDYLDDPNEFKLLPNVLEGIKKFQEMGYRIIVITNQPGIGFGYYTKHDFFRVNKAMLSHFSKAGIKVDKIYFCPHTQAEGCDCRKPGQALIERAKAELNLDLSRSVIIGDRTSDIETGKRAGMLSILVNTGAAGKDGAYPVEPDYRAVDLLDAAEWILKKERGGSLSRAGK